MGLAVPIINGRRYDHTSIRLNVNGFPILGQAIKSIGYRESKKPGIVRGFSSLPLGKTRGDYEGSGDIEIPKEEFGSFIDFITQGGAVGYLDATFEVALGYAELNAPTTTDELNGCQITDIDESHASGNDGLTVRCSLYIQAIIRNGKLPLTADAMIR
jgi:hypothetical protein